MGLHRAAVGIGGAIEHRRTLSCRRRCHCRRRRRRSRSHRRRILRCNQATNVE